MSGERLDRQNGVKRGISGLQVAARVSLLALAWFSASAFQFGRPPLAYDPNHYVNDDPSWALLSGAKVASNTVQGLYTASFPAEVRSMENKPFTITGFMMPLETTNPTGRFVLLRRNSACPFCPPNSPTEAIEVFVVNKLKYTGEEVSVTGELKLVASSQNGLLYRLEGASAHQD